MCGRYSLNNLPAHLKATFEIQGRLPQLQPRYNIAPTQHAPVVGVNPESGERTLVDMRWGLVPHWAKDTSIGNKMFNARAETLAEKTAFKGLLAKRRCVIPASGFYEWEKIGKERQPHYFHLKNDEPMALAGLWSAWKHDGQTLYSFTIITTEANAALAPIHDRMPVILSKAEMDAWLNYDIPVEAALDALEPVAAESIESWLVSKGINRAVTDGAELIKPMPENSQ